MSLRTVHFLILLKNAYIFKKPTAAFSFNGLTMTLLGVFYKDGFVQSFSIGAKHLADLFATASLRYAFGKSLISDLKIVSKPSVSRFLKFKDICSFHERRSILVLSTDKGILTSLECKKIRVGGKALFSCS